MRKFFLFLIPPLLACVLFFGWMYMMSKTDVGKGALQVTSNPKSNVYLDGKFIGRAPFCKCELKDLIITGEHAIKLTPDDASKFTPFEQKITITKSVITVVDYNFAENNMASGSIISLTQLKDPKASQVFVTSFPVGAKVFLDKNMTGETPLLMRGITESDHDLALDKDGYQKKVVLIHSKKGYKLTAVVFLGLQSPEATLSATPTPSTAASASATITRTPTPGGNRVKILDTPTGYLRVRADASIAASETARVNPGDVFDLLDEKEGWDKIKLSATQSGWISSQYVQKQ